MTQENECRECEYFQKKCVDGKLLPSPVPIPDLNARTIEKVSQIIEQEDPNFSLEDYQNLVGG